MTHTFWWRVELPTHTRTSLGGSAPQATLYVGEDSSGQSLALKVAQALLKAQREGWEAYQASDLQQKLAELEQEVLWERLLGWLNQRDLTTFEAKTRLGQEGYSEHAIEAAIERAHTLRYIDDRRYAETYARSKAHQGWGRRRIEHELKRRGINEPDRALLDALLGGSAGELQRAQEALTRKPIPSKHPYESLVRFLTARGFSLSVAKEAARLRLNAPNP